MELIDLIVSTAFCMSVFLFVSRYCQELKKTYTPQEFIKGKASEMKLHRPNRFFIRLYIVFTLIVFLVICFSENTYQTYEKYLGINLIESRFVFSLFVVALRGGVIFLIIVGTVFVSILTKKDTYRKTYRHIPKIKEAGPVVKKYSIKLWNWFIMKDDEQLPENKE